MMKVTLAFACLYVLYIQDEHDYRKLMVEDTPPSYFLIVVHQSNFESD
jgi:hypothetical protein